MLKIKLKTTYITSDSSYFKYVLKDTNIAKELISCFDKVINAPIIISSEVGTGSFNVEIKIIYWNH